jgi:Chlorophyll A-B binding protein
MTNLTNQTVSANANRDRNGWVWGFTPQAENWNGRLAMIGFVSAIITELVSGQGVLHFWNLVSASQPVVMK